MKDDVLCCKEFKESLVGGGSRSTVQVSGGVSPKQ